MISTENQTEMTRPNSTPTLNAGFDCDRRGLHRRKGEVWHDYIQQRGRRYENCRLGNYVAESQPQHDVVAKLTALNIIQEFRAGSGLLLFGPAGTGKDHLLTGMTHKLIGLWGESKCLTFDGQVAQNYSKKYAIHSTTSNLSPASSIGSQNVGC